MLEASHAPHIELLTSHRVANRLGRRFEVRMPHQTMHRPLRPPPPSPPPLSPPGLPGQLRHGRAGRARASSPGGPMRVIIFARSGVHHGRLRRRRDDRQGHLRQRPGSHSHCHRARRGNQARARRRRQRRRLPACAARDQGSQRGAPRMCARLARRLPGQPCGGLDGLLQPARARRRRWQLPRSCALGRLRDARPLPPPTCALEAAIDAVVVSRRA